MADEAPKVPYKPRGFFKPGNKYGKGRPRISLSTPDLLLPAIFNKAKINWANDFNRLYKAMRMGALTPDQKEHFAMLMKLLPYMIAKIDVAPDDLKKLLEKGNTAKTVANTTSLLMKALEAESGVKPGTTKTSSQDGMATGESVLPPPTQPT